MEMFRFLSHHDRRLICTVLSCFGPAETAVANNRSTTCFAALARPARPKPTSIQNTLPCSGRGRVEGPTCFCTGLGGGILWRVFGLTAKQWVVGGGGILWIVFAFELQTKVRKPQLRQGPWLPRAESAQSPCRHHHGSGAQRLGRGQSGRGPAIPP